MTFSISDVRELLVQMAIQAGFPATAWEEFSVGRTFIELETRPYADLFALTGSIGASGFLQYAEGGWLDLCGQGFYATTRQPGEWTRGDLVLSDTASAGPFELAIGDVWVTTPDGLKFYNTEAGTLTTGGTLSLAFKAEVAGALYNLAEGSQLELVTSLPGVTVETDTPAVGTWITTQGADIESDDAYRARCALRWGELGNGATDAAYLFWALTASPEVTRVGLQESTGDGIVSLYLAGTSGPVSAGAVADVLAYIAGPPRRRLPLCVRASVASAAAYVVAIQGPAKVRAAYLASAQIKAARAVEALFRSLPVGSIVYRSQIEAAIMGSSPGMIDVVLAMNTSIVLASNQVPVASMGLTWQTG
jgi:uncharacterized phage protein gp47/JayE